MALLDGAYGAYVVPKKLGGGGVKTYSCLKVAICPTTNSSKSIHIQLLFLILCLVHKKLRPFRQGQFGRQIWLSASLIFDSAPTTMQDVRSFFQCFQHAVAIPETEKWGWPAL